MRLHESLIIYQAQFKVSPATQFLGLGLLKAKTPGESQCLGPRYWIAL